MSETFQKSQLSKFSFDVSSGCNSHLFLWLRTIHFPCILNNYRLQTKLQKGNVFTPVCQSFYSRGVSASVHAGIHLPPPGQTPLGRHPLGRHPLGRHPPHQTATAADGTLLLECFTCLMKCSVMWSVEWRVICWKLFQLMLKVQTYDILPPIDFIGSLQSSNYFLFFFLVGKWYGVLQNCGWFE